jgi:hypothetical protein
MKSYFSHGVLCAAALLAAVSIRAQVPGIITYQGRVTASGTNFTGTGYFKFALLNGANGQSLWSNNGTSVNGSEPTVRITLPADDGAFSVPLGDTTLVGMTAAIPATAFANNDVRLRVWFSAGEPAFTQLTPDQRITSAGYALRAANVVDGAISGAQLANGAIGPFQLADGSVTTPKLANGAVTTLKLADGSVTTDKIVADSVTGLKVAQNSLTSEDIADTLRLHDLQIENAGGLDRVQLTEVNNSGVLYMNHGTIGRFLEASGTAAGGFLRLFDSLGGLGLGQTTVELGSSTSGGYARVFQANDTTAVQISGQNGATPGGIISLYQEDGNLGAVLYANESGTGGGALSLRNAAGSPRLRAYGGSTSGTFELYDADGTRTFLAQSAETATSGGQLLMYQANGQVTVQLDAEVGTGGGGYFSLYEGDGSETVVATAEGGGTVALRNSAGATRASLQAGGAQGGELRVHEADGTLTTIIHNLSDAGLVSVRNGAGAETGYLWGNDSAGTGSGQFALKESDGTTTVSIQAAEVAGNGAQLVLRTSAGASSIVLDADQGGEAKITVAGTVSGQVVEITGGSDLSENFDINAIDELQPGLIVSIDPRNPGALTVSSSAYDKRVAGIVSGAGGVNPGMIMGQRGSIADGKHPVALSGRVYCYVDADAGGAVEPGDLLTTSATPGHAMKANDAARAPGAVIGKAMTSLAQGKGLVLVLVSLQ